MNIYVLELVWTDNVYHDSRKVLSAHTDLQLVKNAVGLVNKNHYKHADFIITTFIDGSEDSCIFWSDIRQTWL